MLKRVVLISIIACSEGFCNNASILLDSILARYSSKPPVTKYSVPEISSSVSSVNYKNNTPSINYNSTNSIRRFTIVSPSMEPVVSVGSVIWVDTKYSFDKLSEGDIIVYKSDISTKGTKNVVHRVFKKTDSYILCKGDKNDFVDKILITKKNYIGKVETISRYVSSL